MLIGRNWHDLFAAPTSLSGAKSWTAGQAVTLGGSSTWSHIPCIPQLNTESGRPDHLVDQRQRKLYIFVMYVAAEI